MESFNTLITTWPRCQHFMFRQWSDSTICHRKTVGISTAYTISGELQHPHHSLEQVSTLHAPSVDSFKTDHRKAVGVSTTSHHCSCQTWPMPLAVRNRNSTVRKPRAASLMWWPLRKYYDAGQKQKQASKQQTTNNKQAKRVRQLTVFLKPTGHLFCQRVS